MKKNEKIQKLIAAYRPGYSLPADFYQDADIYQIELEKIFYKSWIYAGHASQVPEPGCYFLVEFGNESIIIAHGKDGEIHALANVCRHRGSRVCLENSGKVNAFVCPYHAWTYELDGRLRSRREMPQDFKQENHALKPVCIAVFHGLIFINLDAHAPNLNKAFAPMNAALDIYQLDKTKVACQKTYSVNANWKLAIENFMECYHCASAHTEYSLSHTLKAPKDYAALRPAMLEKAAEIGYQTESLDNSIATDTNAITHFYNRAPIYDSYMTGSESGSAIAPLLGKIKSYGGGAADIQFGPLTFAILYADHAVLYRFLPTALQNTNMEIVWLVHENAAEDKDYQLDELTWLWSLTTEADKKIILNNQKGVNSKFYEPGPLSEMEDYVSDFIQWYQAQIA